MINAEMLGERIRTISEVPASQACTDAHFLVFVHGRRRMTNEHETKSLVTGLRQKPESAAPFRVLVQRGSVKTIRSTISAKTERFVES